MADIFAVFASCFWLINEIRNHQKERIISNFVDQAKTINDRLDTIENTLLKILNL